MRGTLLAGLVAAHHTLAVLLLCCLQQLLTGQTARLQVLACVVKCNRKQASKMQALHEVHGCVMKAQKSSYS